MQAFRSLTGPFGGPLTGPFSGRAPRPRDFAMSRWPLRVSLIVVITALVATGLTVSGAIVTSTLHHFMIERVDEQLRAATLGWAHPPAGTAEPRSQDSQGSAGPSGSSLGSYEGSSTGSTVGPAGRVAQGTAQMWVSGSADVQTDVQLLAQTPAAGVQGGLDQSQRVSGDQERVDRAREQQAQPLLQPEPSAKSKAQAQGQNQAQGQAQNQNQGQGQAQPGPVGNDSAINPPEDSGIIRPPSDYYVAIVRGSVGYEPLGITRTSRPDIRGLENPTPPVTVPARAGSESVASWRATSVQNDNGTVTIVALPLESEEHTIARLVNLQIVIGFMVLGSLIAASLYLVRKALGPLNQVEVTASLISQGHLEQRVPNYAPKTEVGRLSQAFNLMLSQIQEAFGAVRRSEQQARKSEASMRRFIGDASHELRTPLTSVRGYAELYTSGATTDASMVIGRISEEAARMSLLVEDLLALVRMDEGRPLRRDQVDMLEIALQAAENARAGFPGRTVTVRNLSGSVPLVIGDANRLHQVIGNLVTNALRHAGPEASVSITLRTDRTARIVPDRDPSAASPGYEGRELWTGPGLQPELPGPAAPTAADGAATTASAGGSAPGGPGAGAGRVVPATSPEGSAAIHRSATQAAYGEGCEHGCVIVDVDDDGVGIPADALPHLFERFYRPDVSRSRASGGSGLGLSIVKSLVDAQGGTITVESTPGEGSRFRIMLPAACDEETEQDGEATTAHAPVHNPVHEPVHNSVDSAAYGPVANALAGRGPEAGVKPSIPGPSAGQQGSEPATDSAATGGPAPAGKAGASGGAAGVGHGDGAGKPGSGGTSGSRVAPDSAAASSVDGAPGVAGTSSWGVKPDKGGRAGKTSGSGKSGWGGKSGGSGKRGWRGR